ncbi:MAG: AmmeMemoRadiSam system protein B [Nitrospirae bacterium]|nr:AmmeMemoRadiSam system protein B [Nitrospirota bacterium]
MKRRPAVAGQFYSGTSSKLSAQVSQYIEAYPLREKVLGIVSPHAGLMYSGGVAGAVYSKIEFPHTFILLGPNHTGLGSPISIMAFGEWEVPTGTLKIDELLAKKILQFSDVIEEDTQAHSMEHSLEVQLPFILHFSSDVMIVPITMMANSLADCRLVGDALAKAIKDTTYPVVIVASSDMSHYETDPVARAKDKKAIDRILNLDPEGLHETVRREKISMCGFAPATAMLFAANSLGAREAELVKYMTSGDVSGDYSYVVGYAGIIIK